MACFFACCLFGTLTAAILARRIAAVVVVGALFSGMSTTVVTPPAAAAFVADSTPAAKGCINQDWASIRHLRGISFKQLMSLSAAAAAAVSDSAPAGVPQDGMPSACRPVQVFHPDIDSSLRCKVAVRGT